MASRPKDSFAPSALKGFLMLVSVAVFVYVVAWLIVFGGSATAAEQLQFAPSAPEVPITETHQFLSYTHPDYNFTIQYPVGFFAQELSEGIASFRASAGVVGRISEVYEVIVDNSTSADSAYAAALQDAREGSKGVNGETATTTLSHRSKSGKFVRIIETTLPAEDYGTSDIKPEAAVMLTGFYDCLGRSGNSDLPGNSDYSSYTAVVIGIVPHSLEADIGIAEHIIETFKC